MVALFALIVFTASAVWSAYQKESNARAMREQAEIRLADLRAQQEHLSGEIATLKTDRGKEAMLREQYEVGRAGEQLIIIVESQTAVPIHASTTWEKWVGKYLPFWAD